MNSAPVQPVENHFPVPKRRWKILKANLSGLQAHNIFYRGRKNKDSEMSSFLLCAYRT